ncbi:hypothetical protein ABAC460_00615 [Asticcacaulis sp. AC460]|uniref:hypothetical protein n=1 Tax=Asticcacaulis sp. AC460 TaxID=1282360 RepID=UPI0003C3B9DA|nr:hypothetical protein [Asticcacaulis sp. AC460]ESQ93604.1 hypothetical protein ABAC460_00615 [Asticcacaulis sp. AC460]
MKSDTAKLQRVRAHYRLGDFVAEEINAFHCDPGSGDSGPGKWLFETADMIAGWIADDTVWSAYHSSQIQVRRDYVRPWTNFDAQPEVSPEDIGDQSAVVRRSLQDRADIQARFPGMYGTGDNERAHRDRVFQWASRFGSETDALFDGTRALRVPAKVGQLVQCLPFLAVIPLAPQIAGLLSNASIMIQPWIPAACLVAAVGVQFAWGAVRLARLKDAVRLRTQAYATGMENRGLQTGAMMASRRSELITLYKEASDYARRSPELYYDPHHPGRAVVLQKRWQEVAEQALERIGAGDTWLELHLAFASDLFKTAYTSGNFKDNFFGLGYPVRTITKNSLGRLWRGSLLAAALFIALPLWSAGTQSPLAPATGLAMSGLLAFLASFVMGSTRSKRISEICGNLVDWKDTRRYVALVSRQVGRDTPNQIRESLTQKACDQQAAIRTKSEDIARGGRS